MPETSVERGDTSAEIWWPAETQLLIDGRWVRASSERTFPIINPANKRVLTRVAEGDEADINSAVSAARTAFEAGPWARMTTTQRGCLLDRLAELIERDADMLARLETLDCGKPIRETTKTDVPSTIECFRFFAGTADKVYGETIPVQPDYSTFTQREPLGVIGQIIPWNFPLLLAAWKLAPALAMGNTVVLKPAEETALSLIHLGELILEAGFPAGVVNIVTGPGPLAGRALVNHPDVDKIAFTGSTAVGRDIVRASSANMKRLGLDLGGKGPNLIFADADLDAAVEGALKGAFFNQGQVCFAGSRLLVAQEILSEFTEAFVERAQSILLGNPLDPLTRMGPVISQRHHDRVRNYLQQGQLEGATLLCGGVTPGDALLEQGYFIRPSVFAGVENGMTIAQEEIFGPVVAILSFTDEAEAIRLSNDTIYGLSAGVWTSDLKRAHRVTNALRAGTVWVNCFGKSDPALPFGGYKQSGYGRDQGLEAAKAYTQSKTVWVAIT